MDAYYLWDPDGNINIGRAVTHGNESKFLVKVNRPNGLQPALDQLTMLSMAHGRKQRLEVHCHGEAGSLSLGGYNTVTNHNVRFFAAVVKLALNPGGLIELLSCLVASQKGEGNFLTSPKQRIEGYREDYHGALRLNRTREYDKELGWVKKTTLGADGMVTVGPPELGMRRTERPHYGGRFTPRENPIQDDPNEYFRPKFEEDGLRFCLELAAYSGCRVRAASRVQEEEGGREGYERLARSPIGNWEYEVFDFHPDGGIQFLGSSPYRGPINSFDRINRFPAA